jgi:hypothetical protein
MNFLRNRIRVRKDSRAHSVSLDWRKTILVASQFFAFLHSLGHELPRQLTGGAAALPLRADSKVAERCGSNGPIVLQNSFLGRVRIFPGALAHSPENNVGGHMNSVISNRLTL